MRLTRAYVELPLHIGQRMVLPENAAAHLLRVLRLQTGDTCVLFNGDGHDYPARVLRAEKRGGEVEIVERVAVDNESPLRIVLVQGIARGEKMDWILQKTTELGVAEIIPVSSDRSEVKLDAQRADKRHAHWRSVVVSACEQCGRARIPDIAAPTTFAETLVALPAGMLRLTLDPFAQVGIETLSRPQTANIAIAIGPEGGFSPRDRDILSVHGFSGVRLGPRILRSETAGIAAIAALQARFGDLA